MYTVICIAYRGEILVAESRAYRSSKDLLVRSRSVKSSLGSMILRLERSIQSQEEGAKNRDILHLTKKLCSSLDHFHLTH